jgi:hypothetical protein
VPDAVSPDISQIMPPSRPFALESVFTGLQPNGDGRIVALTGPQARVLPSVRGRATPSTSVQMP